MIRRQQHERKYEAWPGVATPLALLRKWRHIRYNLIRGNYLRYRVWRNVFHLHNWNYDPGESGFEIVWPSDPTWFCGDCEASMPEHPKPQRWSLFCFYP